MVLDHARGDCLGPGSSHFGLLASEVVGLRNTADHILKLFLGLHTSNQSAVEKWEVLFC